MIINTFC